MGPCTREPEDPAGPKATRAPSADATRHREATIRRSGNSRPEFVIRAAAVATPSAYGFPWASGEVPLTRFQATAYAIRVGPFAAFLGKPPGSGTSLA